MDINSHYIGATAFCDVLKQEDVDVRVLASLAQLNKDWQHVAGAALDQRKEMHILRRWLPDVDVASIRDTHIILPAFAKALQTLGACMKRKKGQRRPDMETVITSEVFCIKEANGNNEQTQLMCLNTLDFLLNAHAAFKKPESMADELCAEMVLMYIIIRYILKIVTTVYPSLAYNPDFLTAFLDRVREVRDDLRYNCRLLPPFVMRSMLEVIHDAHVLFSRHAMVETHMMAIVAAFQ
jgi:hypothetical protein